MNRFITLTSLLLAIPAVAAEMPKHLKFAITKATNPGGQGGYSGTVSFDRESAEQPFRVTWNLSGGSTQTGWGVSIPGSDTIAVAYGSSALGVALYKKDAKAKTVTGKWALAKADSPILPVALKPGKAKNTWVPQDGSASTVTITPSEVKGVANFTFEDATGKVGGIGIAEGDYLAVGTASQLSDFGVVVYRHNNDLTASGHWAFGGVKDLGTENLRLLSIDGKDIPADAAPPKEETKPDAGAKPMSDKELAGLISVDIQKCAAVGEYFLEQVKAGDTTSVMALIDDRAFSEKHTRKDFEAAFLTESKSLGAMTGFTPDKKKVDFKPADGGGMIFTLEGDGEYDKAKTREVLTFFKAPGADKVVLTGYQRTVKK